MWRFALVVAGYASVESRRLRPEDAHPGQVEDQRPAPEAVQRLGDGVTEAGAAA